VIDKFKMHFTAANMVMLCREGADCIEASDGEKLEYVQKSILKVINLLIDVCIEFY
jgi:hypothetical protein